ncbi:MAG TPA: glycosyltransferase [Patescibacteria group bacterium]|nr:glycosyltransferase [Patescibacteria group bacterium]
MKAAIFNPYLDTLGGGERYTMAIATALLKNNYVVDVEWKDNEIKEKLEKRFGIDLKKINFVKDIKRGDGYDICFWVSDGSVPALRARKNFLHFQVPFQRVNGQSLLNKFKLMRINKIIVNSNFTKNIIDKEFGINSFVLYPPVAVDDFKGKKKENIILNVARFSNLMQNKRQDVLIKTFAAFSKANESYKLVLAGGIEVGAEEYVKELTLQIKDYPIEIIKSPDFKTLKDLYSKAKIFWSASGFGSDTPQKKEHFGITVVEAMAASCVPVIFNDGGHREIVQNTVNGFLWDDAHELYRYTKKILDDESLRKQMALFASKTAQNFSYEEFEEKFKQLI